ncbi:MAG: NADPH-dependent FMN reductase [Candidatus Limnocylindrales bacterium]
MTFDIAAFAGSLRTHSLNRRLLAATVPLAPSGMRIDVFDDIARIPLFDEDLEAEVPDGPGAVASLRHLVGRTDGLLIATPEYNQSIPGVTKNVVDWLSRPDGGGVLDGRPVAILGATDGPWGTRYAQKELRHTLTAAGALVMPQPQLFIARAATALDADGHLADPAVERRLAGLLAAFGRWIDLVGDQLVAAAADG